MRDFPYNGLAVSPSNWRTREGASLTTSSPQSLFSSYPIEGCEESSTEQRCMTLVNGLEQVLEEIMGEPVSLKVRSDLYFNVNSQATSLASELPTSLISPLGPACLPGPPPVSTHQGHLAKSIGSALATSQSYPDGLSSQELPRATLQGNSYSSIAQRPLGSPQGPSQQSLPVFRPHAGYHQSCFTNIVPSQPPLSNFCPPPAAHLGNCSGPIQSKLDSHQVGNKVNTQQIFNNHCSNNVPGNHTSISGSVTGPCSVAQRPNTQYTQRCENHSGFDSFNNNENVSNRNSGCNLKGLRYFSSSQGALQHSIDQSQIGRAKQELPAISPLSSPTQSHHSLSTPDISTATMPPVEAIQAPKNPIYSPSSSPPTSISSNVVPNKSSSANTENISYSSCSNAQFSPPSYATKSTACIETAKTCTPSSNSIMQLHHSNAHLDQPVTETSVSYLGAQGAPHEGSRPTPYNNGTTGTEDLTENHSAPSSNKDWSQQIPCAVCCSYQQTSISSSKPTESVSRDDLSLNPSSSNASVSVPAANTLSNESISNQRWQQQFDETSDIKTQDNISINIGPDVSTPEPLKATRYYKTAMPGMHFPLGSAEKDVNALDLGLHKPQFNDASQGYRQELDSNDIIDVVSVRCHPPPDDALSSDYRNSVCNREEEPPQRRLSLPHQFSPFSLFMHNDNARHVARCCEASSSNFPYVLNLYSKYQQQQQCLAQSQAAQASSSTETLDLSTKPKPQIPRPSSPFMPVPTCVEHSSHESMTKSRVASFPISHHIMNPVLHDTLLKKRIHGLPRQLQENSVLMKAVLSKSAEGSQMEEQLPESPVGELPESNLPPHILAWLLSSHLGPLPRTQHLPPVLAPPPSSLFGLSPFYIPSPAASPEDFLDSKPLDLSSKSLNSESSVSWITPDSRCQHHTLGHKASSSSVTSEGLLLSSLTGLSEAFDKADSPAAESAGSTDDGSVAGMSRIPPLASCSFLKHLQGGSGLGLGGRPILAAALGSPGPLSTEELITRVLEAKASGRGRRRTDQSKRSYTDTELQAALRDIQSGRLGTRKAAVLYGIPRSTLRNKVYKLAIEKERAKKILEKSVADGVSLFQMPEDAAFTSSETLRALLKNKMAVKLEEITKVNPAELQYDDDNLQEHKHAQDPALGHLLDNVTSLALNSDHREMSPNVMSSLSLYPKLEDFTKKMTEKRYHEELAKSKLDVNDAMRSMCDLNGLLKESCDPNLNVPSYEPSHSQHMKDDSVMFKQNDHTIDSSQRIIHNLNSMNFKDMIAHYIGQKTAGTDSKEQATLRDDGGSNSSQVANIPTQKVPQSTSITTKEKRGSGKKRAGSPINSGGKGSRPKRGKYRNYDRENLIKAVQAVQSGEMSVHRAGSFYGVPHSTLEYKVKERHLNRGKKKETNVTDSTAPTSPPKNSTMITSRPSMVPTNSFALEKPILSTELSRYGRSDAATIDLTEEEGKHGRESSVNESNLSNKMKPDTPGDSDDSTASPNHVQNNPFNLWNTSSSLLPSFMSAPYDSDSFYASQMIRRFQEAASSRFSKSFPERQPSLSPSLQRSEHGSPIQGQSSGSCSPNLEKERQEIDCSSTAIKSSVLDALLRGKSPLEAAAASVNPNSPQPSTDFSSNSWSMSSRLLNLSKQLSKAQDNATDPDSQCGSGGSSGLAAFNALCSLPSVLGLQTSLAAALQRRISPKVEAMQREASVCEGPPVNSRSYVALPQNLSHPDEGHCQSSTAVLVSGESVLEQNDFSNHNQISTIECESSKLIQGSD